MNNLTLSDVKITDYVPTIYTAPRTVSYKLNGKEKTKNILAERDGVIIVLYNKTRDVLVFVKQFRPAVYVNGIPFNERNVINVDKYPASAGVTLELCAGLDDKNITPEETAKEEILEECGYSVSIDDLFKIGIFKNGVDTTGGISTMFYCEVTDDMKITDGGGVDGEFIEIVELCIDDCINYVKQNCLINSPPNVLYGIYWYLENKCK